MLARIFFAILLILTAVTTYTQTHQPTTPVVEDKIV